jgi:enterobactin synthetase component D
MHALEGAGSRDVTVGVGQERRPSWPAGFVGSITHSTTFAWAVVARASDVRSIGIDSEIVFDEAALREAGPLALDDHEWQLVRRGHEAEGATLVFSAKESLFKCVNPCIDVFFEFADARVDRISAERANAGSFEVRLLRDLAPEFPLGRRFVGRYAIARGHLHTAVELAS